MTVFHPRLALLRRSSSAAGILNESRIHQLDTPSSDHVTHSRPFDNTTPALCVKATSANLSRGVRSHMGDMWKAGQRNKVLATDRISPH